MPMPPGKCIGFPASPSRPSRRPFTSERCERRRRWTRPRPGAARPRPRRPYGLAFPGRPPGHEPARWVVADVNPGGRARVTLTPPAINAALAVAFLVTGADKAATLRAVHSGPFTPDLLPAQQGISPRRGRLVWLLGPGGCRERSRPGQLVSRPRRSLCTEGGEAPGWQGATDGESRPVFAEGATRPGGMHRRPDAG